MICLDDLRNTLPEICLRYRIEWVDVFGSISRNTQRDDSDIDLVVEFMEPRTENISRRFFGFLHDLEDKYHTRVDLITERSMKNPYFKAEVDRERIRVYGH